MKDRLRLAVEFDHQSLRRDLALLETTEWVDHFVRQHYEGAWRVLPLRAPAAAVHPIQMIYSDPVCDAFVDTPLLARCHYFQQVLAALHCPLLAVRLMKLEPGSTIRPHSDYDLAPEHGRVRLHIPVMTNPDVEFSLNGTPVTMREGECWYLRLSDTHSVVNRGTTDRVHLVVDALMNPWLDEQLRTAATTARGDRLTLEETTVSGADRSLSGCVPVRVRVDDGGGPMVDWCFLGEDTFSDPFFQQTIERSTKTPLSHLATRPTPMAALLDWRTVQPGIEPTAFIFHSSRCGSTLLAQMAAAAPRTVVISEAPPVDDVVRARAVPEGIRVEWLRAVLSALGQQRRGDERHLFVKFDAWHVFDLALVQRAFPRVPCVFLYREPAALIASQLRMPGVHMLPGVLDPALVGLDLPSALQLRPGDYAGRMLEAIYATAVAHAAVGRVALMNYAQFPAAAVSQVLTWCGLACSDDARQRLADVALFDAKTPSLPYDASDASTRPPPDHRAVEMAARFLDRHYVQLEAIRLRRSAVPPILAE